MPKAKGNYCNVEGCHNRSEDDRGTGRHYYRLPAVIYNQGQECENLSAERRRLWLAALNQDFTGKNLANVRVCSDHFVNKKADLYQRDSPDWVPSINMCSKQRSEADLKTPAVIARYLRKVKRRKESTAARALLDLSQSDSPMTREVGCQCNTPVLKSVAVQAVLAPKKPKRRSKAIQVRPLVSNCASVSCSDEDLPVKSESSFTSTSIKRPRMEDSSEETSYSSEEPTDDTHMPDIIQEEDIKLEPCDSSYIVVTI